MAGDCRYPLTLLKRVRRSGKILQRYGKDQNRSIRSTDLPFLASQKLILASQQGYFPDSNRFDSICFHIFKGDDYTLALPINSPSGVQGERIDQSKEDEEKDARRGIQTRRRAPQAEASSKSTVCSRIQRPFRELLSLTRVLIP